MKAILLAGAALLTLSGAAIAQDAASGVMTQPPADASGPSAPETAHAPDAPNAPTTAASENPTAGTAQPTDAAASAAQTPAPTAQAGPASAAGSIDPAKAQAAQALVQKDWATYDQENKGSLTPLEFGTWIMAASGQDLSAQVEKTKTSKKADLPAVKVLNATATEFAKADKDKNRLISPDELTAYLSA